MAKRIVRTLRQDQKEFLDVFSGLCYSKSDWQVWTDFIFCTAVAISNSVDREGPTHDAREDRYITIMKGYKEQERMKFPELVNILVDALEKDPDQDFLGEMFMALELGSHWHGQFFTPFSVCRMMAKMQISSASEEIKAHGWVAINDPACGAGALLIAARNEFAARGVGFQQTWYVAQDIDQTAGLMCYIQLSLLGCAGYVAIADTICNPLVGQSPLIPTPKPGQEFWFMPMTCDMIWQERIRLGYFKRLFAGVVVNSTESVNLAVATALPDTPEDSPIVDTSEAKAPAEAKSEARTYEADDSGQLRFF